MNTGTVALAHAFFVALFFALPAFAVDEDALKKDLSAVIALQGLPCGEVVVVKTLADNDYLASCKDKNTYRVYLNAEGRVVVEKGK